MEGKEGKMSSKNEKTIVLLYMPVLHQGYLEFFNVALSGKNGEIWLLGKGILDLLPRAKIYRQRDLRAVDAFILEAGIRKVGHEVKILNCLNDIKNIVEHKGKITMPDEDISHEFYDNFHFVNEVTFVKVFLRMDKKNAHKTFSVIPDTECTKEELHQKFMQKAKEVAGQSYDWWRQVGSVLIAEDSAVLTAYNHHYPDDKSLCEMGDVRAGFSAGESTEISTSIHSEISLIASAAKQGVKTEGAILYVTTFPCHNCAKAIVEAGIKVVYFEEGYSKMYGQPILRDGGVKVIRVIEKNPAQ